MPWSRVYYTTFLSESEVLARISAVWRMAEIHEKKKKRTPTDVSVVVLTRTYFVSDFTSSYIGRTGLFCGLVLKNNFKEAAYSRHSVSDDQGYAFAPDYFRCFLNIFVVLILLTNHLIMICLY